MWMSDQNLIYKENGRIFVGNEEFDSATSALGAYIDIFKTGNRINTNSKPVKTYERKVGDILLAKSCLQLTEEQSLDDGVRDTPYEIHLFNQKKKIEKQHEVLLSSSVNTDVTSQADRTVKEIAGFLDNFQTRCMSPATLCRVSDIGSMTTEYLLSASPYSPQANPIERDPNGVCTKCSGCSGSNSIDNKQLIPKTRSDILKKTPLPLPINSYSPFDSYFAHVGKSSQIIQNCVVNKGAHAATKIPCKVKNTNKDKKKVCMNSMDKDIFSPQVEFRKAENLTCPKADWQNIDSTPSFNNCQNGKIKPLRKIQNNASPNKHDRSLLLTPSKTDFLQTPSPYSEIKQNTAKKVPKSQCKASLSKNILYKSTSTQTCKELSKFTESKNGQEFATMKKLKSVPEKKQNPSKNLVSKNQKNHFSYLPNSPEIAEKHNSENSSVDKKISKIMKRPTKSEIISKDILCSAKKTDVSNISESTHFHSLSISSIHNQPQTLNKSILPDNQNVRKKSIAGCDHLSNYPQVPNWVKQLESSMITSQIETPIPTDEVSYKIPAQQVSPPNLIQSWSLSEIPFISPEINHNKTSHSLRKNSDSNCSVEEYQELSQFKDVRNVDTSDQAQFHSESIQNLLDRYLNDQTKELSELKNLDNFTDDSLDNSYLLSGQLVDDCASHRSSCLNCLSTPPLSPISCEAILDYSCFDKNEEMLNTLIQECLRNNCRRSSSIDRESRKTRGQT